MGKEILEKGFTGLNILQDACKLRCQELKDCKIFLSTISCTTNPFTSIAMGE
jgi:hypothetical protein